MPMSFTGLSSAATRLELRAPHRLQRWIMAHSPPLRTHTAIGSITPPQSEARSPGSMSTWRLDRQFGQWLRWSVPASSGVTSQPQTLQVKVHPNAHYPGEMFLDCPGLGIEMHPLGRVTAEDTLNPAERVLMKALEQHAIWCLEAMVVIGNPEG